MKLRIKGSTLRLRLSKTEVNRISAGYLVQETVYFGKENTFKYVLKPGDTPQLTAVFEKGTIKVIVPEERLRQWCENEDDTGFDQVINHAEGTSLYILVEKDFKVKRDTTEKNAKA